MLQCFVSQTEPISPLKRAPPLSKWSHYSTTCFGRKPSSSPSASPLFPSRSTFKPPANPLSLLPKRSPSMTPTSSAASSPRPRLPPLLPRLRRLPDQFSCTHSCPSAPSHQGSPYKSQSGLFNVHIQSWFFLCSKSFQWLPIPLRKKTETPHRGPRSSQDLLPALLSALTHYHSFHLIPATGCWLPCFVSNTLSSCLPQGLCTCLLLCSEIPCPAY